MFWLGEQLCWNGSLGSNKLNMSQQCAQAAKQVNSTEECINRNVAIILRKIAVPCCSPFIRLYSKICTQPWALERPWQAGTFCRGHLINQETGASALGGETEGTEPVSLGRRRPGVGYMANSSLLKPARMSSRRWKKAFHRCVSQGDETRCLSWKNRDSN